MIPASDRVPSRWLRHGLWTVLFVLIGWSPLQAQSITEYTMPTAGSNPWGIAAGPDGALWFTESVGKIGRITTSGTITEYTVPTAVSLGDITAGPDGALWFTDFGGNKIGRITTSGTITNEYPIPTANSRSEERRVGKEC